MNFSFSLLLRANTRVMQGTRLEMRLEMYTVVSRQLPLSGAIFDLSTSLIGRAGTRCLACLGWFKRVDYGYSCFAASCWGADAPPRKKKPKNNSMDGHYAICRRDLPRAFCHLSDRLATGLLLFVIDGLNDDVLLSGEWQKSRHTSLAPTLHLQAVETMLVHPQY